MSKKYLFLLLIIFNLFSISSQAREINNHPITAFIKITKTNSSSLKSSLGKKEVFLMPVHLTSKQKRFFSHYPQTGKTILGPNATLLPDKVDVGMNGVPVLDQGRHGSCVTFASTAAIDALLGKGDYISQLCSLELGSYLEKRGYIPSGWNGSNGPTVLNLIQQYGIISKDNQRKKSCSGVIDYPLTDGNNIGNPMSLDEFKTMSEGLEASFSSSHFLYWEPALNFFEKFVKWQESGKYDLEAEKLLLKIKKFLADKENAKTARLTFGTILPVTYCSAGACARFHAEDDTWALTDAIKNDRHPQLAGHEMVITGYDNNAIAVDNEGKKHQGLLILRNSWGSEAGDEGNYYMTYDFFKWFVMEVQKVYLFSDDEGNK